MRFYDKLTEGSYAETTYSTARPLDDDVKQTALLRTLVSYVNKFGTEEGFEEYSRSPKGESRLKAVARFSYLDLFNSKHMKKNYRGKNTLNADVMKEPVSMTNANTLRALEQMSAGEETNITRAQKRMELQDQLRSMYTAGDDLKKKAMDLMVEAMQLKDDGKPVPARIRTALSRLRDKIQETDPRWKLDLHML